MNLSNDDTGSIAGSDTAAPSLSGMAAVTPRQHAPSTDMTYFAANWEKLESKGGGNNALGFQVGVNAGDFVYANVGSMNTGALGLELLDISTVHGAWSALRQLDNALDYVNNQRGLMGAQMNRFEAVIATLNVISENTTAARGRIIDADFATETATLSRTQILMQAGTAMTAQANQQPQMVLSLLR